LIRQVRDLIKRTCELEEDLDRLWKSLDSKNVIGRSLVRQSLGQLNWVRCCLEDLENNLKNVHKAKSYPKEAR
jgi:hypothetical protein